MPPPVRLLAKKYSNLHDCFVYNSHRADSYKYSSLSTVKDGFVWPIIHCSNVDQGIPRGLSDTYFLSCPVRSQSKLIMNYMNALSVCREQSIYCVLSNFSFINMFPPPVSCLEALRQNQNQCCIRLTQLRKHAPKTPHTMPIRDIRCLCLLQLAQTQ